MQDKAWFRRGLTLAAVVATAGFFAAPVQAQSVTTERQTVNTPAPAAAPASSTTVVQAPPAAQAPVAAPSSTVNKQVVTETRSENFMGTIAKNTLFGALAGGLVGGAIYLIDRDDMNASTIAYWASGGALVGVAVGVMEVSMREDRNERAVSQVLGGPRRANIAFVPRVVALRF